MNPVPKPVKTKKAKKVSDTTLLRMFGDVVKKRAHYKCEYPDCKVHAKVLHPHHYYSKKNASVRYDPDNGICLCAYHHTLGAEAAHRDPNFKDVILQSGVRDVGWHNYLTNKKNQVVKNNQFFKENWKITLKVMLESYDG